MRKDKYRILIIHNYYQIPGGEDTVVKNEKKLLEDYGHEVFFYSRSNSEIQDYNKLQKLMLPLIALFSRKSYKEIKKIITENNIDIVHVHNTLSVVSPSVYYAAFSCNKPVIQTLHNFRLLCPAGSFFRENIICEQCISGGLKCAVKHSCYRQSKAQTIVSVLILKLHRFLGTYKKLNYICLSEFNKEKLLMLNNKKQVIDETKVFIKPNFTFQIYHEKSGKKEDYFIFVGRLESLKGVEMLVNAFSQIPTAKLKIVGKGPLESQIKKYIVQNEIKNIDLEGYLTGKEYVETLEKANALVVTSQCYETFGMGIAEAFSHGVPAIVGDIGNIRSMVTDGVNGIRFKYNSEEALIEAIRKFEFLDPDKLSEQCFKYYNEHLAPEQNYKMLIDIYDNVMNNNS